MKKSLTFIFVLLLSLCFASLTVGAKTGLVEGVEDGKDYYVVDGTQVVLDLQFDGEGVWGDKNGLYVPGAQTVEADGYLVYSGAASWTQYMIVKPNDEYKNSVLTVTVVAELDGISDFYACARQSYGNNGRPDILREPGIMNATYTDGKLTSFDTRNGWLGASDDKSSDSYTINEKGQLVFQFQVITAGNGLAEIGFEVYDSVDQNGTVKIDSLVITKSNMQTVYENGFDTDGAWGDKEGIYAPNSTVEAGHLVYNGVADYTEFMSLKSDAVYTNSVLFVDMAVELVGVDQFMMTARQGWANAAPDIIREVGIKWPQYDENGKLTAVTAREGWLGKSDDYSLDTYTIDENGILHIHFVVKTGELGLVAMPFQVVGLGGANATVKIDYIKVQKAVAAGKKYYTLAWDTGFEDADLTLNAWDVQPIWGNEPVQFETEYALDGSVCIRLDGTATTQYAWGDALGGFDTVNPEKALLKSTGLHYIQMDIDSTDFAWFNIWTGADDYYEIKYTLGSGWSTVGKVQNFKAVDLGTCWRISWYCDYTNMNVNHGINAYDGTGSIYIDNLIVAYVDNAPFATNSTYNLVGTEDVVLDVNFKEQTLVALNDSEGNAIDASLYAIENNQLTLKKELFASCEASYVFNLVSTGGARQITIKQNDNRVHITGVSATISKVYDGTTSIDASGVAYVLAGVAEGDEVTLTAELAFADKNVGTEKEITVTNVQLSGADAGKYVLPETVTLTGSITPKELTVEFETTGLSKVYDGTTSAQVAIKALNGVVEGDEVAAQLTAEYNSANVDASQINVTLTLTGAQKDNYTIANATIEEGVAITPKSITVVANAQTKEEEAQDPELTYTVTGLVGTDALTGELARNAGEAAGEYDITLGTLSAGDNYTIEFTGAKLTITEKVVTPDPEPGTDEGCKLFGYELVMQLVLFLSVLATALYFVRKR